MHYGVNWSTILLRQFSINRVQVSTRMTSGMNLGMRLGVWGGVGARSATWIITEKEPGISTSKKGTVIGARDMRTCEHWHVKDPI